MKRIWPWIESVVITTLFIIFSWGNDDFLSLQSAFPWIWIAPVLIALRYGLWPTQLSILLLVAAYFYEQPSLIEEKSIQHFFLGGFVLTLTCAIFNQSWAKKIHASEAMSNYLQQRIQTIANAYRILTLAYERLEHQYIAKPATIRNSLSELKQLLATDNEPLAEMMDRLLNLLSLYCNIEVAGIFPVKDNIISIDSYATVGQIQPPDPDDFLIQECINNSEMSFISAKKNVRSQMSNYLVAAPFFDAEHTLYAILLIQEIPFLNFNEDNLSVINLFLEYFATGHTVKQAEKILKPYPDCPIDFANELQRLMLIQQITHYDSAILAYFFSNTPRQKDYLFCLQQEKRGLDSVWLTHLNHQDIFIVLMPLTNREGMESYKSRINTILTDSYGITLQGEEIKYKCYQLSSFQSALALLEAILQ